MLFSSIVQAYQCTECKRHFSHVIPTSFIPIVAVFVMTTVAWSQLLALLLPNRWLVFIIALTVAIGILTGMIALQQRISRRWLRHKICSQCGGQLKAAGGGIVDGARPGLWELSIYTISIAIPVVLWLILESSR
jgi:hypothetical protein